MTPELLWTPSPDRVARTTMTRYLQWLERERGLTFATYDELWRWSVDDLEAFWSSIWEFFGVVSSAPYRRVLGTREMPGAEWFPGAILNYAENTFRGHDDDAVAIRHASELRTLDELTWRELRELTSRIAGGLRSLGVGPGDRVAAYLPNIPEAVAAFLACSSIGATWSSCSPDFGVRSVVDRFAQIEPTVLLAVDGYRYGGRDFDRRDVLADVERQLPTVRRTVVLGYLDDEPDLASLDRPLTWKALLKAGEDADLTFEQLPFAHPLWVLYSSGTTGLPKPIVHSQGGVLVELTKVLNLHVNAQQDDRLFWFTTTGWMMWNFLVGALLTDASIVLYDGNPGHPDLGVLWELADEAGITIFGTSAAFITACMKSDVHPGAGTIRAVGSTGSPLPPEGFDWVYRELGSDTWLFSTSGGTDVCSAFVGGVPTLPVYRGELQARALGASVEAWDEDGNPVVGEVGELVITRPMPSMPIGFWNDPGGSRYRESYFEHYPGVWRHGDWIELTERGTAIIYGRSDSTINRGGIRMGTSEIYRAVLAVPEVVDALVVDVPRDDAESWMPLFVVLRDGAVLDETLIAAIRRRIREDCSPRHVPDEVIAVREVPRTLSGKVLEVPVKRILQGEDPDRVASRDSLANPDALTPFLELYRARRQP